MRKIVYGIEYDKDIFSPYLVIKVKDENGNVNILFREEFVATASKYTPEQQAKINQVNNVLGMNGGHPLTDEECDWMLDPNSLKAYLNEELEEDKIQRLAGFKVEKTITYFNDSHEENK